MTWLKLYEGQVESDWLDELDHVNFLTYQKVADEATMEFWLRAHGGRSFEDRRGQEYVLAETHVRFIAEMRLRDPVTIETALVRYDTKRFQLIHRLSVRERASCVVEILCLGFDLNRRRVSAFPNEVAGYFAALGPPPADAVALASRSIQLPPLER